MKYEIRERLATEFAGIIRPIREERWEAFSEAAVQIQLDPYLALARILVRAVEQTFDGANTNGDE